MSYIVEKSPYYYKEWQKINTFKESVRAKELKNMQELQLI